MYKIEIRKANKKGWHTPAEARKFYGRYSREGVTWHWWNTPSAVKDSDHDNIVNYILGKASRGTGSVNYVLSNKKITLLVNPDDVAWASQRGNPTTISVELSPHLNAEGYKKAGWLFNELEGRYKKKLNHFKHSFWYKTACPGSISIDKIKEEATKWRTGAYNPKPAPKPKPTPKPMNVDFTLWKDGGEYVANKKVTVMHDLTKVKSWSDKIPAVKTYKKGDRITIAGSFKNVGLNRTYYITRYSFDKKNATGFNPADLDVYVPPRPTPKPPEVKPNPPVEPTDPEPETPTDEVPGWFKRFLKSLADFLTSWRDKGE